MAEAVERESWDIAQGVEKLSGVPIPDYKKFLELEICAETATGEDALMPTIKYAFKGWKWMNETINQFLASTTKLHQYIHTINILYK